jgi:glycosyltransferase involved in cell wall biosynthesis
MALGVPVVASDLPALAEVLLDGAAGVLVRPGDPAALAAALAELLVDQPEDPLQIQGPRARRARLVSAARAEVAARRTWQAAASTYRDVYSALGVPLDAGRPLFT